AVRDGARILSLSGPTIDRLRLQHQFFRRMVVPSGQDRDEPVRTIGVERLLVCRRDLDPDAVYSITKAYFEMLPTLAAADPSLRDVNWDEASATPIPLHEGAA